LLERYIGREATLALCAEVLGCPIDIRTCVKDEGMLLELRRRVNEEIEAQIVRARRGD
jgi:hypothetical protein